MRGGVVAPLGLWSGPRLWGQSPVGPRLNTSLGGGVGTGITQGKLGAGPGGGATLEGREYLSYCHGMWRLTTGGSTSRTRSSPWRLIVPADKAVTWMKCDGSMYGDDRLADIYKDLALNLAPTSTFLVNSSPYETTLPFLYKRFRNHFHRSL